MLCGSGGACRRPEKCVYGAYKNGQWTTELETIAKSIEKEEMNQRCRDGVDRTRAS